MNRNWGSRVAPVKVGEELDVKIEAVGEKGDGVAKKDGFVLFVPNTKSGDEVRVRVTKVLPKVGFAEVISGGSGSSKPAESEESSEESDQESSETEGEAESEEESSTEEETEDSENFGEDLEGSDEEK